MSDDNLAIEVTKAFSKWGYLRGVKVLRDTNNRPYAFVQYNNDQDARRAILGANNTELSGRIIRCERAKVNRTLFFTSSTSFNEIEVKTKFESFGELENLYASDEKGFLLTVERSKSWYIKFVYREDAIRSFVNLKTDRSKLIEWCQNIETKEVDDYDDDDDDEKNAEGEGNDDEEAFVSGKGRIPVFDKKSIFIGQLTNEISKEDLLERFSKHGEIVDIYLSKRSNVSDFAFIKFKLESSAATAVEKENHSMFKERTMHVQYKEIHTSKFYKAKESERKGVQLAPPPINFTRRIESDGKNYRVRGRDDRPNIRKFESHGHRDNSHHHTSNYYVGNGGRSF